MSARNFSPSGYQSTHPQVLLDFTRASNVPSPASYFSPVHVIFCVAVITAFFSTAPFARADAAGGAPLGGTLRVGVTVDGDGPFSYQWKKDGVDIPGATSATYTRVNAQLSDAGDYKVLVSNYMGSALSDTAVAVIGAYAPAVTAQPVSNLTVQAGQTITLTFAVNGIPTPTIQWQRNGVNIPGANSQTLTINGATAADAGTYTAVAFNQVGTITSSPSFVSVVGARLINVSVRTFPGTGSATLIAGFVTQGGPSSVLVRGVGPALSQYTSAQVFSDPLLSCYVSGNSTAVLTNDDWGGSTTLKNLFTQVGAFSFPDGSKDAAIATTLQPNVYSAVVTGPGTGLALAEVYDTDTTSAGRIVNLSARTQVGAGDAVLIAGFVIGGSGQKQLLIRGIGPALTPYGVTGALVDPRIDLYVAGGTTPIQSNDDWAGATALTAAFNATGAFALPNANSKDSAMIVTLNPGAYSVILSGVGNTTGVGLIELYEMP
jgi:hypothetical protein